MESWSVDSLLGTVCVIFMIFMLRVAVVGAFLCAAQKAVVQGHLPPIICPCCWWPLDGLTGALQ